MERIIDDFESRRRAEEIYSRRNGINVEKTKKKYFSIYKFLFQLLVLINLSICFVVYKNKDFIFSVEFINEVNEFYNINVNEKITEFFMEENSNTNNIDVENTNIEEKNNEITNAENLKTENDVTKEEKNINENIQGQDSKINDSKENKIGDSKENIVKNSYSFIKPLNGTITSFFGNRESQNKKVTKNHTGIDISAVEGTKIKSSIAGKVILVDSKGDYGNHIKIQNQDIITLYAHCKKILVNVGDEILQGQDIAEVGSSGNSTGPHLHFEIRYLNECIDPLKIISF